MTTPTTTTEDRKHVRVDLEKFDVFPEKGHLKRIGKVVKYVERQGAKTPTGGRFTARRITVRLTDGTLWVGQFKNGETRKIILRPLLEQQ